MGLHDNSGSICAEPAKMQQIAIDFFKNLFSTPNDPRYDLNTTERFLMPSTEDLNTLCRPVVPQEIKDCLFQIGRLKAPGHDGFPAAFFQDQWTLCAPDIIKYVSTIFDEATIPPGLNHTIIALVPKTTSPQDMNLFRPISLCCTIYKVISKIIVARLRPYLCDWISPNQVSYVPGRHISDNIMIVQELIHKFRHAQGKKGFIVWKIDLSKAYDRLRWDFIQQTLTELHLPQKLIKMIMSCITSTSFQISINGELTDTFTGNRGIRQGDPLSPYLFVICMEKLSHLIQDKVDASLWKPVKATRYGPLISHLFFADDLILFSEASPQQARILKNTINSFCKASGQSVNFDKSAIYCSPNTRTAAANEISSICGSPLTEDLGKYLGMPILHSRTGKHTYASLIDKAESRLASWKSKTLNIAGRLTLIQSVTAAIPIYAMQTTKLPIHTCEKLDGINRGFLWGDTADQKKVHLVNWSNVCRPKNMGGLGLKKTRVMNQAMLAKTGWRMVQNDTGLWNQIFRKKYNLSSSFPHNYHKPAAVSNSWSSVIHGTKLLCKGLKWKLGDGTSVKFWKDIWTNFGPLLEHAVNSSNFNANAWVCDFWVNRSWSIPMLSEQLPPSIVDYIVAIPIPLVETADKITWSASPDGKFSVKSAYLLNFHDQIPSAQIWSKIWKLHIPPKMKVFLWTMAADKLLTNVQRMHRKFTSDPSCFHCPGTPETLIHLFKDCPKAKMAWNSIHASHISSSYAPGNWHDWFHFNLQQITCLSISIPWNIAFTFICWHIWKWRCKCIFDSSFNLPHDMRSIITTYIEEWTSANRKNHKHWTKSTIMLQWDKPPPGTLKINVDGSHNSRGHIGAGGILRDNSGHWCSGFTVNLGTGDTDQAEAWGIFYGLQMGLRYGAQHVELESDAATVINLLQTEDISSHPLSSVIQNCKLLCANFITCATRHIHREKNIVADILAKASLSKARGICWIEEAPPDVYQALAEDMAGVSRSRMIHHNEASNSNLSLL